MSTSTDAILCYGVEFEEGYEFPWDDAEGEFEGFEEWWTLQCGVSAPKVPYSPESKEEYNKYWDIKREKMEECPVELVLHCSGEYPMYIIAAKGSVTTAYRGTPVTVSPLGFDKTSEYHTAVAEFVDKYEIFGPRPDWLLCSYWG